MAEINTVKDKLDWCYANLAAYQVALKQDPPRYVRHAWMVRAKLFKGLQSGSMHRSSIYRNERIKLSNVDHCAYCNCKCDELTLDHLFPKSRGGTDDPSNLVYVCKSCNSSKGAKDYFSWCSNRNIQINADTAERYLKNAYLLCIQMNLLDCPLDDERLKNLPFDIASLPEQFDI